MQVNNLLLLCINEVVTAGIWPYDCMYDVQRANYSLSHCSEYAESSISEETIMQYYQSLIFSKYKYRTLVKHPTHSLKLQISKLSIQNRIDHFSKQNQNHATMLRVHCSNK